MKPKSKSSPSASCALLKTRNKKSAQNLSKATLFIYSGIFLVTLSSLIFIFTFFPVLSAEIQYFLNSSSQSQVVSPGEKIGKTKKAIYPLDEDFGIIIPKINANAKIIANVDPFNKREYQLALSKGIAHAKGTVFPGQTGNIFLFSHSSVDFYQALRYNSIFYLLNKLEKDDEIYLFYKREKFKYKVKTKKTVKPSQVQYLNERGEGKTLTLMTCWPPGTTFDRLLVVAEIAD